MPTPADPTTDPAPAAPERLGPYEIVRLLAVGGMAELHLARTAGPGGAARLVVIKRVLPQLANQSGFVRMFLAEARLAATLHHPNIVHVYDTGSAQGSYFCAMEFLHGADVRQIFRAVHQQRREAMPIAHATNILAGVSAGLHYAHEKTAPDGSPLNLVHRDVSPQNVFVTFEGGVKLLDFGIAKTSHRMTASRRGPLRGKLAYTSPEQCRGEPLDRRADVYAAAVMLWELTTGQRLRRRQGDTPERITRAIIEEEPPPPSAVVADYPPDLEAIVMRGLRRDRDARYQTARELQLDLEAFATAHGLALSTASLAEHMRALFPTEIESWERAEREASALTEHIALTFQARTREAAAGDEAGGGDETPATAPAGVATPIEAEPTARQSILARSARFARAEVTPRAADAAAWLRSPLALTLLALILAVVTCVAAAAAWLLWR
ncbi:MAG TPA: serine/threonine-protein kinase [Polyangia bacterium]